MPTVKNKLFSDKAFYKSLFIIAIPIMLQNLINTLVNILDTIMIGRLGTVEIAAVGLGNQVFFFFILTMFGICSGAAIFTAQFWGKRDIAGIRKNVGFSLCLCLIIASFFTTAAALFPSFIMRVFSKDEDVIRAGVVYLQYLSPAFIPFAVSYVVVLTLRSIENLRLAIVSTVVALSVNLVLNYVLIFGMGPFPALGLAGAAIATDIARLVEVLILVIATYVRRYPIAGSIKELLGFNLVYVQRFFKISFPVILNEIIWSAGITVQNVIFARTNTDAIAAFNITNTVSQLAWVVFIGLGSGGGVLIGKRIGEGNNASARDYASRLIRFTPLVSIGAILILIPLSQVLGLIFRVNDNVIAIAGSLFIVLCVFYPARAFNMAMVVGICRAGGDTIFCILYDIVLMWTVAIPLAAAASFIFDAPVWLIYTCLMVEEPLKLLLGLWRFRSGKWLHNVTEGL
ncbi:MATE family efflux transporter [Spirochaetia bacterium]|nr:MATE family efflux transporter [Spirochaetia bacterium]